MKSSTGQSAPLNATLNETSARLLAMAAAISALLVWSGLKAAQELFPNIPAGVTVQALLASVLAAITLGSLINQGFRARAFSLFARYSRWLRLDPVDALLITLASFISLAAWSAAGLLRQTLFPTITALLWTAALASVVKVGFQPDHRRARWSRAEIAFVAAVTLAAFLIRGLQLDTIPWLLTGDEGSIGLSAFQFAQGEWDSPFNLAWFSFPSLFFMLPGAFIKIFGNTTAALRLPSAIAGALTVLALYGYGRRAFGRIPAVLASTMLAAFHFHIHFSRLGLNNIWDGFFFVVVAGTLWRAWVRGQPSHYIWPGVGMGLSIYFYATSRFIPILVLGWLILAAIKDRRAVRQQAAGLLVMALASLAVALPLLAFFSHHPQEFMAPFTRVGALTEWLANETVSTGESALSIILEQLRLSSLAFFSVDLRTWYLPEIPMLMPLASTLFGLGCIILLLNGLDLRYSFLILWLLIGIVSGAASESTPAAQHFVFIAPPVMLVIGVALAEGLRLINVAWPNRSLWAYGLVGILVLNIAIGDLYFYFGEFSAHRKFGDINTETANVLAEYLQNQPAGADAYFLTGRMGFYSHSTVPFLAPHVDGYDVSVPIGEYDAIEENSNLIFLVLPERVDEMEFIHSNYPGGTLQQHKGQGNQVRFFSYSLES
ncbi:MAG: ArnT family glycosyltransferase [Anaerolineales bacterium]